MKNHFSNVPSLDEVRSCIVADTRLSPSRRAAVSAAINVACRWMGLRPNMAPANVAFLRERLARIEPASVGVTPRRFFDSEKRNALALRHLGLTGPGTYLVEMTVAWKAVWQCLPDKYARTALSRLFRYCSGR